MRKLALVTVVLVAAVGLVAGPAVAQEADLDCKDFNSQAEAQAKYEEDTSDPHRLDADNDGQACETFPYDQQGAGQTPSESGTAGEGLPFTGPRESLLPLGVVLMVVGAGAVAVTRYRGRHATR
jgi:Excalibur calcium-binding domain